MERTTFYLHSLTSAKRCLRNEGKVAERFERNRNGSITIYWRMSKRKALPLRRRAHIFRVNILV